MAEYPNESFQYQYALRQDSAVTYEAKNSHVQGRSIVLHNHEDASKSIHAVTAGL